MRLGLCNSYDIVNRNQNLNSKNSPEYRALNLWDYLPDLHWIAPIVKWLLKNGNCRLSLGHHKVLSKKKTSSTNQTVWFRLYRLTRDRLSFHRGKHKEHIWLLCEIINNQCKYQVSLVGCLCIHFFFNHKYVVVFAANQSVIQSELSIWLSINHFWMLSRIFWTVLRSLLRRSFTRGSQMETKLSENSEKIGKCMVYNERIGIYCPDSSLRNADKICEKKYRQIETEQRKKLFNVKSRRLFFQN